MVLATPAPARRRARAILASLLLAAVPLAATLVAPATPAAAAGVVDQRNDEAIGTGPMPGISAVWARGGQTFTAGMTGALDQIDVYVQHAWGTVAPGLTVRVHGAGGVIGTGTVAAVGEGWVSIPLSSSAPVVQGAGYAMDFVVPGDHSDAGLYLASNVGRYGGGNAQDELDYDVIFRTYVDTALTGPTVAGDPSGTTLWAGEAATPLDLALTGSPTPTVAVDGGSLPPGMTLTPAGRLEGTPTSAGTFPFTVRATNGVGFGATLSTSMTVQDPLPSAPIPHAAHAAGVGAMDLSWEPPARAGRLPVTSYVVSYRAYGEREWIVPTSIAFTTATSATITGLPVGQPFEFAIAAVSGVGTGPRSPEFVGYTSSLPSTPYVWVEGVGDGSISMYRDPGSWNGGAPITAIQWQIRLSGIGEFAPATLLADDGDTATIGGLVNGEAYDVRLVVTNAHGSVPSEVLTATPFTTPAAPIGLVAIPGDGVAALTWSAPDDRGSAVTGYRVEVTDAAGSVVLADVAVDGTTATIGGLVNGAPYALRVLATNASGDGAWSASAVTTPFVFAPTVALADGDDAAGSRLRAGDSIVVRARDLPVGAVAVVELHSTPVELGRGIVDANGQLAVTVAIPAAAEGGAHEIVVRLLGTGAEVTAVRVPVTVEAPLVVPPPVPAPGSSAPAPVLPSASSAPAPAAAPPVAAATPTSVSALPRTGIELLLLPMLLLGAALVLVGGAARRRAAHR